MKNYLESEIVKESIKKYEKIKNSLSVKMVIVVIGTLIVNAISIITAPIFTRILTVEDYGIFSLFSSWMSILLIIFGGQTYGTLNNAKVDYNEKEYKDYCINAILISTIGFLVLGGITIAGYKYVDFILDLPQKTMPWLVGATFGLCLVNIFSTYLIIEGKVVSNLVLSVTVALSTTLLSIVCILFLLEEGYQGRVLGYSIPYILVGVFVIFYFVIKGGTINRRYWSYCLKLSSSLIVHSLAGVLLVQSDRIMLNKMGDETMVGIYSICYTISLPVTVIMNGINSTWVPMFYQIMKTEKKNELELHFRRQMILAVVVTCGYMLVVPEVLKILSTSQYWSGIPILSTIVISCFFNFLYLFPVNYEFYYKKNKYIAISTVVAALLNIILNCILIPELDMKGAAIATVVSYMVLFIIHDIIARKMMKEYQIERSFYIKGILVVVLCFLLNQLLGDYALLRWSIGVAIGVAWILYVKKEGEII